MGDPGQLKPVDLLKQEPDALVGVSLEHAEDTITSHFLAWLNSADSEDTTLDSPGVTAFLPDLSAYVGDGSSPKEQEAVARLGDSEGTVPDVPDWTALLADLLDFSELPDFSEFPDFTELPDVSRYVEARGGEGGSGEQQGHRP